MKDRHSNLILRGITPPHKDQWPDSDIPATLLTIWRPHQLLPQLKASYQAILTPISIQLNCQSTCSPNTSLTCNRSDPQTNPNETNIDLTQPVNISIPGFQSLNYLSATSEEGLYTLSGETSKKIRKRLRYAPGTEGRAKLRLRHELNVLKVLEGVETTGIWKLEGMQNFPDKGICAIYTLRPFMTFKEYVSKLGTIEWWSRLGNILRFAQSLTKLLSSIHQAGIFRNICSEMFLTDRWTLVAEQTGC